MGLGVMDLWGWGRCSCGAVPAPPRCLPVPAGGGAAFAVPAVRPPPPGARPTSMGVCSPPGRRGGSADSAGSALRSPPSGSFWARGAPSEPPLTAPPPPPPPELCRRRSVRGSLFIAAIEREEPALLC